ncbi:MFS transporter [Rhodococcus sp. OK302]|nr:MFS transporter [Rhodococcus sp. OK302]
MDGSTVPTTSSETRRKPYLLVLMAMVAAESTGAFEAGMLIAVVPKLIADFNVTTADIGWAFTGFYLMVGASAAIGGRLGDLFGRKKVLIIVLLLSIIGSVVSVAVGTFTAVVVGRTLQGVSGAVLPLVLGVAREAVLPRRVPVTLSVVAGVQTLAGAAGFYVSGLLIEHVGWQAIFIVAAALAAFAAVVCAVGIERSPVTRVKGERIDFVGGALFVPALALILYGATSSQTKGWGSPTVLCGIGLGVVVGTIWVLWELRVENPLLNLRLLAKSQYALTLGIFAFVTFGALGGMQLVQPILFQGPTSAPVGLGLTPSQFGQIALVLSIVGFLFTPLSGRLARISGARTPIGIGIAIQLVTLPGFYFLRENLPVMIALLILGGTGLTFVLSAIPNLLAEFLPQENMGEGMGVVVVVGAICKSVGISAFAVVLSSAVVPGTQFPQVSAYGIAIGLAIIGVLIAMILVFLIPRRAPTQRTFATGDGIGTSALTHE